MHERTMSRTRLVVIAGALALGAGCAGEEPSFRAESAEACEHTTPTTEGTRAAAALDEPVIDEAPSGPQPLRTLEDGSRLFGRELQDGLELTALSAISADATSFTDRVVRTEGTIERVCQRMGCWMELRAENAEPVRVPMAGHSYFLPRDVTGRPATIEGRVMVQPLSEGRRRHLEAEGALATSGSLSIEATTVLVR